MRMADVLTEIGVETQFVVTPYLLEGLDTIRNVVDQNRIAAVEGPAGSGKTTTVRYFTKTSARPCVMATMPGKPNPLDLLRFVYYALHGTMPPKMDRFRLQNSLLQDLKSWRGVLIVDELQNSAVASLQDLVWLYEESQHAFAVVVVGTNVIEAIGAYPQLLTRVMGRVSFQTLQGESLMAALRELDPRLRLTSTGDLLRHDRLVCHGVLRTWVMTVLWLNSFDHPMDEPVSAEVFANIGRKLKS